MSECGSFVTEWIRCETCRSAVAQVIEQYDSDMMRLIPLGEDSSGNPSPVLAGTARGGTPGEAEWLFTSELTPLIAAQICHPVRFALLPDGQGACFYQVVPGIPNARIIYRELANRFGID
jgi:hypothetical protein